MTAQPDEKPADLPALLRDLLAAATPGPWVVDETTDLYFDNADLGEDEGYEPPRTGWFLGEVGNIDCGDFSSLSLADATLAAAAVNALPSLLDELDRLRAAANPDPDRIYAVIRTCSPGCLGGICSVHPTREAAFERWDAKTERGQRRDLVAAYAIEDWKVRP